MSERSRRTPRGFTPVSQPWDPSVGEFDPEAAVSTVHMKDLLRTLRRHLWLVFGVAALAVAATGYLGYRAGQAYRAVAVIRLSDPRRALTGGVVDDPARTDPRFADPLLSQVALLTSRMVAGEVVDSMPMLRVQTWKFPQSLLGKVAVAPAVATRSFQIAFGPDTFVVQDSSGVKRAAYGTAVEFDSIRFAVLGRAESKEGTLMMLSREAATSRLISRLRVRPRIRTDVVDVAYTAPDPQSAQQVVNRAVEIFRTTSAEAGQQLSRRRREFLAGQLKVNDSLLADAREALTAFNRRARGYGSREALAREQSGLAGAELQGQQLIAERRTYQDLLVSLRDSSASRKGLQAAFSIPGVAASPAVAQLNTQLFQYETARDSLASRSASHPDLPRFNQLISSTQDKLVRAVQIGVQSSIASLDVRIAAINDLRARQQELSGTEAEEARLTERVENARTVSDQLRTEYQKSGIAEAVTVGQVEIVDRAILPTRPVGIPLAERLALGLLVGLVLGAAGAFLAERLGSSIGRRVQVEELRIPVLGVVPHSNGAKVNGGKSPDAMIEAFRGIRLSLVSGYGGAGPIVVTLTSPGSGDGKSFVSSNLALAFAQANYRTLLVDADLRRGALHRRLDRMRQPGLTDFLVGDASLEQVLQTTTHASLDLLAGGSRRRDAPELIGSRRMADLLTSLRSSYDVIVVDTPPLGAGVDAIVLATLAGTLLMVLRLGKTDREVAKAQLEMLRRLPLRLLGGVLNGVRGGSEYRAYAYYLDGYELSSEPALSRSSPVDPALGPRVRD
jgi:capsular exopolysaccharide synthesis family protein